MVSRYEDQGLGYYNDGEVLVLGKEERKQERIKHEMAVGGRGDSASDSCARVSGFNPRPAGGVSLGKALYSDFPHPTQV